MGSVPVPGRASEIERLMDQHGDGLLRLCYLYLGDLQLAEDAVQEAFFKAYLHLDEFRGDSSAKTWLTRIAINACISTRRTAWFRRVTRSPALEQLPGPTVPFVLPDDTVASEIAKLPQNLKQVILLYYYQDLKIREIADMLGISESAVSVRLTRARTKLKLGLKGWYAHESVET